MPAITFKQHGDWNRTSRFLRRITSMNFKHKLEAYGKKGVDALSRATPMDSGKTAESWKYEIHNSSGEIEIVWSNTNVNKGVNIAVILQYGHGTRNGGYVRGRDYINPAIQPIFDEIRDGIWKEVTSS